ncbi:hypothetical protein AB1Y20_008309 [Prymnesium parvum]|uniref:Nudix hydrolase domain-containing protein n=1 Tax=Prymnesium parvum TaxID=97485 RepID=A0AB34IWR8_PRYPA
MADVALLLLLAGAAAVLAAAAWRRAARTGGGYPALFRWLCVTLLRQRLRAGCVPITIAPGGRLKLLLIRSRKHPEWLTFPAGGVERGETLQQAAVRETFEEAGVSGQLGVRVAEVRERKAWTVMYSLYVHAEHTEYEERARGRCWLDLGVPGSPQAAEAVAEVRKTLSQKAVHQQVLEQVLAMAAELAKQTERNEQESRQCGAPLRSHAPRLRSRGAVRSKK